MMNEVLDDPLSSSSAVDNSDSLFTLDDYEDNDDGDEADLFGRISSSPTGSINNNNSNDSDVALFADVDKVLQESQDVVDSKNNDVAEAVPDASFYRPENPLGGSSSMFYSTIYDNIMPPPPTQLPPPPPTGNTLVANNNNRPTEGSAYFGSGTDDSATRSALGKNRGGAKFEKIVIHEPRLVHTSSLVFSGPSFWTYAITSTASDNTRVSVRRRFRHFVALEDRIHKTCPGLILPPRPEKHPPLSDEALYQTMTFAKARAVELQSYLCGLLKHPLVPCVSYPTSPLHTFLTFPQEDLGVMWSEVSSSTLKRLSVSASRLTETVSITAQSSLNSNVIENDLVMRNLLSSEQGRLNVIENSIPKLLGYLTLLQEFGLFCGSTGMELSKLNKDVRPLDPDISPSVDVLGMAFLRSSRRLKKQHHDVSKTLYVFENELRYIASYQSAFSDRKNACLLVDQTRSRFLDKSNRLLESQNKSRLPSEMNRVATLEQEVRMSDSYNADAVKKAENIGHLITQEVSRLAQERRKKWGQHLLTLSIEMKQVCIDQADMWETAKNKITQV